MPTFQIARDARLPAPSTIKVKSLHANIQGPQDAWGRPDRPQPIEISAAVSLDAPFGASSATDTVASDTVHYGLLSKAILSILATSTPIKSLRHLLDTMWVETTGFDTRGQNIRAGAQPDQGAQQPFLHFAQLRALEITLNLPKATLLGDGVSLKVSGGFGPADAASPVKSLMLQSAVALKIHGLRVPTLIGVNSNERMAKQVVIATVEIDRLEDDVDVYPELEQVIVTVSCIETASIWTQANTLYLGHVRFLLRDTGGAWNTSHCRHSGTPTRQARADARWIWLGNQHFAGEAGGGAAGGRGMRGDEHKHGQRTKLNEVQNFIKKK